MTTPLIADAEPVTKRYFWPGLLVSLVVIVAGVAVVGWLGANQPERLQPTPTPQQPPGYQVK